MKNSGNFTRIENKAIHSQELNSDHLRLYAILKSYNPSFPGYNHIRGITRWGKSKISACIKFLKSKNMIRVKRGGLNRGPNQYECLPVDQWTLTCKSSLVPWQDQSPVLASPTAGPVLVPGQDCNNTKEKKNNNSPRLCPGEELTREEKDSTPLPPHPSLAPHELGDPQTEALARRLDEIDRACKNPIYLDSYGSPEAVREALLRNIGQGDAS